MSLVPAQIGPMKYLPAGSGAKKIVQYLGYNWFLCAKHVEAIKKIDHTANQTIKKTHQEKKSYHLVMICFEALPLIGHLVSVIEALCHRVEVKTTYKNSDKKYSGSLTTVKEDLNAFNKLNKNLQKDHAFLLACIQEIGEKFFKACIPRELQYSYPFCLQAVARNGGVYKVILKEFQSCEQMILEAFAGYVPYYEDSTTHDERAKVFNSIPNQYKNKWGLIYEILKRNGLVLQYLDQEMQNDRILALIAIESNYRAYLHASKDLRYNNDFCYEAYTRNHKVYSLLPKSIQETIDSYNSFELQRLTGWNLSQEPN